MASSTAKLVSSNRLKQYKASGVRGLHLTGAAVALPAYAAYKTAKEALDFSKRVPGMMKDAPILHYAPEEYMAKHGDTAFAAAGTLTAGRFTAKPSNTTLSIGYKSLRKGLRKDAAAIAKKAREIGSQSIEEEATKAYKEVLGAYEQISPKLYKKLRTASLVAEPFEEYSGAYYPKRIKSGGVENKTLSGRSIASPATAHNVTQGPITTWKDTTFHELEHHLDDRRVYPSRSADLLKGINNYLKANIGSEYGYAYSPSEEMANRVAKTLSATSGKITKKKWLDTRDELLNEVLGSEAASPKWKVGVPKNLQSEISGHYKKGLAKPKRTK